MLRLEGILPAMITPMTPEQTVNEEATKQLSNRLIDAGANGLYCLGTNGEFFSLNFGEKLCIVEAVVEAANGRVPVYAGAGAVSTSETIMQAKEFKKLGADAISVITPYFLAFTQKELLQHYLKIADAVDLPIVIYNIPVRTGNHLDAKTVATLSKIPNVVGIKDSSGRFDVIEHYIQVADEGFSVMCGVDSLILATLLAGGSGAVSATANVLPELITSIYQYWKSGDIPQAANSQKQIYRLRSLLQGQTIPSGIKEALNILGFPAGPSREPTLPMSDEQRAALEATVLNYVDKGVILPV